MKAKSKEKGKKDTLNMLVYIYGFEVIVMYLLICGLCLAIGVCIGYIL